MSRLEVLSGKRLRRHGNPEPRLAERSAADSPPAPAARSSRRFALLARSALSCGLVWSAFASAWRPSAQARRERYRVTNAERKVKERSAQPSARRAHPCRRSFARFGKGSARPRPFIDLPPRRRTFRASHRASLSFCEKTSKSCRPSQGITPGSIMPARTPPPAVLHLRAFRWTRPPAQRQRDNAGPQTAPLQAGRWQDGCAALTP